MKKIFLLFDVVFCCTILMHAQKIQYSRQTFKMPYADAIQLVANISGNHHLICFNSNKSPDIYIFDAQLQLLGQKIIDFKLKETSDIRLLPFKDFYLLYVHTIGTTKHELFKIDGEGNVIPLLKAFQQIVEKELNNSTSTLQLINQNERLYVIAHTYYDAIKKIGSNVVELDMDLNPLLGRKVLYSFNKDEDVLQQTVLVGNSLLVLKTSKNDEKGNSLDVAKVDLATGHILTNSFNSGSHLYTSPALSFNSEDSSILVHSMVRQPVNSSRLQRSVFLCRLNYSLQELTPVTLLQSQFNNNAAVNYLLAEGTGLWLNMNNSIRFRNNSRTTKLDTFMPDDPAALNIGRMNETPSAYFTDYNQPTGVRFSILNEQFKVVKDSLVANNQRVHDVQPRPFAQLTMKNKSYLILVQNFTADRRGLLMLSKGINGELWTEDIRVFDKYQYLLSQSQSVKNSYFILPYANKKEIGLVKITPE